MRHMFALILISCSNPTEVKVRDEQPVYPPCAPCDGTRISSEVDEALVEVNEPWSLAVEAFDACDVDGALEGIRNAWAILNDFRTEDVHRNGSPLHDYPGRLVDLEDSVNESLASGSCP